VAAGWEQRAQLAESLVAGTYAADREVSELLTVSPESRLWAGLRPGELQALLDDLAAQAAAPANSGVLVARALADLVPADGRTRLLRALDRFARLPVRARSDLLDAHAKRRAAWLAADKAKREQAERASETHSRAKLVEDLLKGTLPPDVDPAPLLRLELFAPPTSAAQDPLGLAQLRLRQAQLAFFALPADTRNALLDAHSAKRAKAKVEPKAPDRAQPAPTPDMAPGEASTSTPEPAPSEPAVAPLTKAPPTAAEVRENEEEKAKAARAAKAEREAALAAAEKRAALAAAQRAQTEAKKKVAEEKARLLGVKAAQKTFTAELNRRTSQAKGFATEVTAWQTSLEALEKAAGFGDDVAVSADALYDQVAPAVASAASRLASSLEGLSDDPAVPRVGEPPQASVAALSGDVELRTLRTELLGYERDLLAEEERVRWQVTQVLGDELARLGELRSRLLPLLGEARRGALTGFAASGVEQVKRELAELQLLFEYRMTSLPREFGQLLTEAGTSPVPWIWYLVKVLLAVAVLRWWRRHADTLLVRLHDASRAARGESLMARLASPPLWYLGRLHPPLAQLVFWGLVLAWTVHAMRLPELEVIWLVLKWIFIGQLIIGLLDAVGARSRRYGTDTLSDLRFRSLRLVGLTIVAVGLLLALTARAVGQGAIYHWVLTVTWVLALPIAVLLVRWWRPEIIKRAALRRSDNPLIRWVADQAAGAGLVAWTATALGGVYLFVEALYRQAFRQLALFDTTRRALAFLARRGSEARHQQHVGLERVDAETLDAMTPSDDASPLIETAALRDAADFVEVLKSKQSAVMALVGERGAGKTAFLQATLERAESQAVIRLGARSDGFSGVRARLCQALGLDPEATREAIVTAVREQRPEVICIDQCHRIVRPEIGGLEDFDGLVALAREAGGRTCWVLVFDSPVWMHIVRARGDRAVFTKVTRLVPWTEDEVAQLCLARAEGAGLTPSFEGIEVPRLPDDDVESDEETRNRRGFFRILWDYAAGNPAIAMHFWARSLFVDGDGKVVVRMFEAPNPVSLSEQPASVYFVLRAIVQREWATLADIASSTLYAPDDVSDALAWAERKGAIEFEAGRVRIDFEWYRAVTTALKRRHLLT